MKLYTTLRYLFVLFYVFAGANHFINPHLYWPLIPNYLSDFKVLLNIVAGIVEVLVALLMLSKRTVQLSSYLTIAMLIAFVPSHIYFIQKGDLQIAGLTITPTIAWLRLLIVHPILIFWAWWLSKRN